jgi:hypothetical protein
MISDPEAEVDEQVTLQKHQWNVIMDILRVDTQSEDAANRLGDVARQAQEILDELQRQLNRDGIERH